jgi:hypothetical protein
MRGGVRELKPAAAGQTLGVFFLLIAKNKHRRRAEN